LPRKGRERRDLLAEIAASRRTVVVFEAANRLVTLLNELAGVVGSERIAVVGRELTKLHEDIRRDTLAGLHRHYTAHSPLGEVTLLVAGASESEAATTQVPVEVIND